MVFKSNETIASLYEGITKQAIPSADQLVRQAPTINKTELSKDYDMLQEAYKSVGSKCTCMHAAKGCDCGGCDKYKANQEPIEEKKKEKPDYSDVDEDGDKKESMNKALKDKKTVKENLSFKELFNSIMSESKKQEVVCGTKINPQFQYKCTTKDGEEKTLKGESVIGMKDKLKSVKAAH